MKNKDRNPTGVEIYVEGVRSAVIRKISKQNYISTTGASGVDTVMMSSGMLSSDSKRGVSYIRILFSLSFGRCLPPVLKIGKIPEFLTRGGTKRQISPF